MTEAQSGWVPIDHAVELLQRSVSDTRAARLRLIKEMQGGWLRARATRWFETGNPRKGQQLLAQVDPLYSLPQVSPMYSGALIPNDFWHENHALDGTWKMPSALKPPIPRIAADWNLLRFSITYSVSVDMFGQPQWGEGRAYPAFGERLWERTAIGVHVDVLGMESLLAQHGIVLPRDTEARPPTRRRSDHGMRGLRTLDEPFVQRGLAMLEANEAKSPNDAAVKLEPDMKHGASPAANIDRIGRRIRERLE